jgi:hypothetical protein
VLGAFLSFTCFLKKFCHCVAELVWEAKKIRNEPKT